MLVESGASSIVELTFSELELYCRAFVEADFHFFDVHIDVQKMQNWICIRQRFEESKMRVYGNCVEDIEGRDHRASIQRHDFIGPVNVVHFMNDIGFFNWFQWFIIIFLLLNCLKLLHCLCSNFLHCFQNSFK